jgi:uncharacterized protein with NRDE domain
MDFLSESRSSSADVIEASKARQGGYAGFELVRAPFHPTSSGLFSHSLGVFQPHPPPPLLAAYMSSSFMSAEMFMSSSWPVMRVYRDSTSSAAVSKWEVAS